MELINEIYRLKKELAPTISNSKTALKRDLDEHLTVYKSGNCTYWRYIDSTTKKRVHVSKSDRDKAVKLALKTYNRYKMRFEVTLYSALCAFDEVFNNMPTPDEYLDMNPGIAELVLPNIPSDADAWKSWENEHSQGWAGYEEDLVHKTLRGEMVRSKSEMIIADTLLKNHVPYVYESVEWIDGVKMHPDFKVANTRTGKTKIWEHAGMMDNPEYVSYLAVKQQHYAASGYRLGIDLIITTENTDHPFDSAYAQEMIDRFLK